MRFEFPSEIKKDILFGFENKSVSYGAFYDTKIIVCCKQEKTVTNWIGKVNPQ